MRVVHVINDLSLGGAETLLCKLVSRRSKMSQIVVSLGNRAWYSDAMEQRGIEVHYLDMNSAFDVPAGFFRLRSLIASLRPEVVQCWLYRSNLLAGLAARTLGIPVVWGIHCSSLAPLRPLSRFLARLGGVSARWVPDFIINCSAVSARLHATLGYSAAPGQVIYNGYDSAEFFPDDEVRGRIRKAMGVAPDEFAIGTIGRWHPQKDIPNLVSAAGIARSRGVPLRCYLIGAGLGLDNRELAQLIESTPLRDFAVPLGPRSDIQDIARALDLHVLASSGSEAFPNSIAETMLSGTPNAVTDVGDSAAMAGESGWVAEPRRPEQLADAIAHAYREKTADPTAWAKRRIAAREQIMKNFSLERMAQRYEAVWRKVSRSYPAQPDLNPTAVQ